MGMTYILAAITSINQHQPSLVSINCAAHGISPKTPLLKPSKIGPPTDNQFHTSNNARACSSL